MLGTFLAANRNWFNYLNYHLSTWKKKLVQALGFFPSLQRTQHKCSDRTALTSAAVRSYRRDGSRGNSASPPLTARATARRFDSSPSPRRAAGHAVSPGSLQHPNTDGSAGRQTSNARGAGLATDPDRPTAGLARPALTCATAAGSRSMSPSKNLPRKHNGVRGRGGGGAGSGEWRRGRGGGNSPRRSRCSRHHAARRPRETSGATEAPAQGTPRPQPRKAWREAEGRTGLAGSSRASPGEAGRPWLPRAACLLLLP